MTFWERCVTVQQCLQVNCRIKLKYMNLKQAEKKGYEMNGKNR